MCFLKNLNFLNHHTNNTISFDANGNPRSTHYTVLKLEVGNKTYKSTVIGNWSCRTNNTTCERNLSRSSIEALNPGWFNSSCGPNCRPGSIRALQEEFPDCCWECQECTGNQYSNSSNQLKCLECPDDRWPDSKHTSCVEIEHDYLDTLKAPGILILIWNCLGMAVILVTAGVFLKYGSSHIVRASSRQLSFLLLLGISVDFALLMALLREPNASQCAAVFVLTHAANCLVSGTLFLKTNRIHRIFRKSAMKGTSNLLYMYRTTTHIQFTKYTPPPPPPHFPVQVSKSNFSDFMLEFRNRLGHFQWMHALVYKLFIKM